MVDVAQRHKVWAFWGYGQGDDAVIVCQCRSADEYASAVGFFVQQHHADLQCEHNTQRWGWKVGVVGPAMRRDNAFNVSPTHLIIRHKYGLPHCMESSSHTASVHTL